MADSLIGKTLPDVQLASSAGGNVKLPDDLKGHWTLLYFYPKDDTPGCTKQACSYRDNIKDFESLGVKVFGVSLDDLNSHEAFINKYQLNFPLLADVNHELSEALSVKSRDTFLIDPQGKIKEVWRKVRPEETVAETLLAVRQCL